MTSSTEKLRASDHFDQQLVDRVSLLVGVAIAIMGLSALIDYFSVRSGGQLLLDAYLGCIVVGLVCLGAIRRKPTRHTATVAAVTVSLVFCTITVLSGIVAGGYASTILFCMGLLWVTAALLPWGLKPQIAVCAGATSCMLVVFWVLSGSPLPGILPRDVIILLIGAGFSLYISSVLDVERGSISQRLARAEDDEHDRKALHELLDAMHRTEREFISTRDMSSTIKVACASLLSLSQSEAASTIYIADRESGRPRLRITGAMCRVGDTAQRIPAQLRPDSDSAIEEALATGEPVVRGGLKKLVLGIDFAGVDPKNATVIPVEVADICVGAVVLVNRVGGYDEQLLDYIAPFVSSLAHLTDALENDELRRSAEAEVRDFGITLERRIRERTLELEKANLELEAFSYSVSHDLRGPLRAISGFAELVLDESTDGLSAEAKEHLNRVHAAALRMDRIIDDLLTLARVSRREVSHAEVDLSRVGEEVVAELCSQDKEKKGRVTVTIEPNLLVAGDSSLLAIALGNLLGNAWKFVGDRPDARIELGKVMRKGRMVFFIRDNGVGFDMDYVDKLFAPFERLHDVKDFPGTGIGLAIVARIISRHGGEIWAEGKSGEGAVFYFTLPQLRRRGARAAAALNAA